MKTTIINRLKAIEKEQKITILFACESGSRAWGFPSPDSDYDIRFIYKRSLKNYLTLTPQPDFINFSLEDELDFQAWDIRKVLGLLYKGNASIQEYLQSPIVYIETPGFKDDLWKQTKNYYNAHKNKTHYLGITNSKTKLYEHQSSVHLKALFYSLRSVLSALWIHEKGEIPPMELSALSSLISHRAIKKEMDNLIQLKANVNEDYTLNKDHNLWQWVGHMQEKLSKSVHKPQQNSYDLKELDRFFIKVISSC